MAVVASTRWRRVLAVTAFSAIASGAAACSSSGPTPAGSLPDAASLLQRCSARMRGIHSARFQLSGKGSIAGVEVDTAQGLVTSDGKASGTVEIVQAGSHVQLQLVVIRRAIYIKGPTGGFQKLPSGAAGAVFDPSRILDPRSGLSRLVATATAAKTVGVDQVSGVSAYRVTARLDGGLLASLMPIPARRTVPGTMWIGTGSPDLDQITVTVPGGGGSKSAELTLRLTDFGVATNITPPP